MSPKQKEQQGYLGNNEEEFEAEEITREEAATAIKATSANVAESRHKLLRELATLGVDSEAFRSLSIGELNDLLYGLTKAINTNRQPDKTGQRVSNRKENSLPILSASDKKILKSLLSSGGRVSSLKLSRDLDIPLSTVQRRRRRLEESFLEASYELKVEKFGWRKATLFLSTEKGLTSSVASDLLAWKGSILSVYRIMGSNEIDLEIQYVFRQNTELLNMIEKIRTVNGVKNVSWNEAIEVIGTNPNEFESIVDSY